MSTVWVTGAHGFIGRQLSRELAAAGHAVIGVGHGAWPELDASRGGLAYWLNGEISASNLSALRALHGVPQVVFHLAGGSSVGASLANPREDFGRTVSTTVELLEWLRQQAPETALVAVSSAAVYGAGHSAQIGEDAVLQPYSPYGYHKMMMEELCRSYAASFGLRSVVTRLFSVYGAGLRKQLLWDLCNKLSLSEARVQLGGSGAELRDWIEVRDVVRALAQLSGLASVRVPVVNVGTGVGTSVSAIASAVAGLWNGRAPGAELSFNGLSRAGDPFSLVADPARLYARGFQWQVSLEQGLADYVRWCRAELESGKG